MKTDFLRRTIREAALLWLGCAIALFAFSWIRVWITSQVDMSRAKILLENMPEWALNLLPVSIEEFLAYPARIAMCFEEPIVYALVAVWAIARGSDAVSGKISAGTMEMLLAEPISRLNLLLTQAGVAVAGLALLVLASCGGIAAGIATNAVEVYPEPQVLRLPFTQIPLYVTTPKGEPELVPMAQFAEIRMFLPAALNLFGLGVFLAGLTTLLSACDRYRWRTIGILASFLVVQIILEVISLATPACAWLSSLTVLSLYEPVAIVVSATDTAGGAWSLLAAGGEPNSPMLGPLGYSLLMLAMGMAAYAAAAVVFCRRDLPAPL